MPVRLLHGSEHRDENSAYAKDDAHPEVRGEESASSQLFLWRVYYSVVRKFQCVNHVQK